MISIPLNLVEGRTIIPKIRLAVATMALPVPRSFVGNNSGVMAYNTPYMTLLVKLYAQFQPRRASEERAVVETRMNTPVSTVKCTQGERFKFRMRWYTDSWK